MINRYITTVVRINSLKIVCVLDSTRLVASNLNLPYPIFPSELSIGANLISNRRNQDLQTRNILPDLFRIGIIFQSPVQISFQVIYWGLSNQQDLFFDECIRKIN